jgi:hypothetical protein
MKVFPSLKCKSELEKREEAQEATTQRRAEETADLVLGQQTPISLHYLSYPVLGMAVVLFSVYSGFSMIRQHDIMEDPKYW